MGEVCGSVGRGPFEVENAAKGQKCLCGGSAMQESDAGPAPTARAGSVAAGVHTLQARAEVGATHRPTDNRAAAPRPAARGCGGAGATPPAGPQSTRQGGRRSRDLWAQIVALGWHPCLCYQPHVTFRPEGQTPRVPVCSLITGPGDLWVGTGQAFRNQPLDATRGPCGRVLHDYGQGQPRPGCC